MKTLTKEVAKKLKKGTVVYLATTSKHKDESENWMKGKYATNIEVNKIGQPFTIDRVNEEGWFYFKGCFYMHPCQKFSLTDK